ncbi:hypothetical protein LAZ40_04320 [Cereibacter sphaeroides]|uniref:hypothetical protein n=1 Tax=Cereibacter sphaeroides TaxID=1063 RepID=UPI001F362433|nr:hypothetical protein [Cereibacter sphaeroides]MCE6958280.1 hypothetical protein [Cereibacter sphaeroides]MCE6971343.1 hypothetical protein [Cereibacter sphaeroides]
MSTQFFGLTGTAAAAVGIGLAAIWMAAGVDPVERAAAVTAPARLCLGELVIGAAEGLGSLQPLEAGLAPRIQALKVEADTALRTMPSNMVVAFGRIRQAGHSQGLRGEWTKTALEGYLDALERPGQDWLLLSGAVPTQPAPDFTALAADVTMPAPGPRSAALAFETLALAQVAAITWSGIRTSESLLDASTPIVAYRAGFPVLDAAAGTGFPAESPRQQLERYRLDRMADVLAGRVRPVFGVPQDHAIVPEAGAGDPVMPGG